MSERPPPQFGSPAADDASKVALTQDASRDLERLAYETAVVDHRAVLDAQRSSNGWTKAHAIAGRRDAILEVIVALRDPAAYGTSCTVDIAYGLTMDVRKRRPLVPGAMPLTFDDIERVASEFPEQGTSLETGIEMNDAQRSYWDAFNQQMSRNAGILRASAAPRVHGSPHT